MEDPFEIPVKLEGFAYRWIRNTDLNILKSKAQGWQDCSEEDKKINGDLILMRMSESQAKAIKEYENIKPVLQQRYAENNYYSKMSSDEEDRLFNAEFIDRYTFSGRLKRIWLALTDKSKF